MNIVIATDFASATDIFNIIYGLLITGSLLRLVTPSHYFFPRQYCHFSHVSLFLPISSSILQLADYVTSLITSLRMITSLSLRLRWFHYFVTLLIIDTIFPEYAEYLPLLRLHTIAYVAFHLDHWSFLAGRHCHLPPPLVDTDSRLMPPPILFHHAAASRLPLHDFTLMPFPWCRSLSPGFHDIIILSRHCWLVAAW